MCGIAGVISFDPTAIHNKLLYAMRDSLRHRGPDDEGVWIDDTGRAGFAHTRLCVIDKSKEAAQPLHYLNRYSIIYNGEVYNYRELRRDLEIKGYRFTTNSDTEVIVASYAERGDKCLDGFDGMFSFAIWDNNTKQLFCARDRFGEKPFYYYHDPSSGKFYFASELKAFYSGGITRVRNNEMLYRFLVLGQTINPENLSETFDKRIKRLPASHFLSYSLADGGLSIKRYWNLSKATRAIDQNTAISQLTDLLSLSVNRRLRSDVPLGTSLSGGVDSSTIASLVANQHPDPLKTFTAVFPGFEKDESQKARQVANRLGFENVQVEVTAAGFVNDFEKLIRCQEEPFTSSSVYAQYKVFEAAAANNVTVLLDGQGADETFAGYDKYRRWKWKSLFPKLTTDILNYRESRKVNANQFVNADFQSAYSAETIIHKPVISQLNDWLYYDVFYSGLEELLRYADKNSMAHGREVRLPFLNHSLVSFVFSLPSSYKIGKGYTKLILREAMKEMLPREVTHSQQKIGFEPPQETWMKNKLVQELIMNSRKVLVEEGILSKKISGIKPGAHDAYVQNINEWKWLVAGAWIALK